MVRKLARDLLLSLGACVTCARQPALASNNSIDQLDNEPETVMVVGSHITSAQMGAALPVTILTPQQIAATGAVTGDDLLRTLPSMGNVTFNSTNDQQTSNAARGDVASIDLRGSGLGDTLVLLNGRRIVEYPTSQSQGGVPLISYNAQALPTTGLERVEVLRQGAAAIYGADAVAGVVNLVTKTDFDGTSANLQYGFAEGTHLEQPTTNLFVGRNFDNQRGNVSLIASLFHSTAQVPGDEPYTASQDLRPLFASDPGYNSSSAPDGRGNQSSYAALLAKAPEGAALATPVLQGTVPLTTAAGSFHVQPSTLSGCVTQIANGLCYARGAVPYSTTANVLRYDANDLNSVTISPQINRQNYSLSAHYDVSTDVTVYTDVQYYRARSHGLTTQPTALVPIGVPVTNYYNPLGPVTFPNGMANPNRLPGLTNVPAAGLPVAFSTYRFNDFGPDEVDVDSFQDRFLIGAKGILWGFQYDSALLYGEARVEDTSDAIDSTLLTRQLALSTPDAYNPFNGGCLDGSGGRDCTPSTQAALDPVRFRLKRVSTTSLINLDYKLSRPDLLQLPGGNVGLAVGVEGRREAHSDVRDPRVDGAVMFSDPVLHTNSMSDAVGVNTTPSSRDSRNVVSLFSEFAIPLVSPASHIPLVQKVDLQLAGRLERYSDFGRVTRPKAALAWDLIPGVVLRASWERGFKAPNLETMATYTYARAQTVTDWYRCQAALNKGTISNFNACTENFGITYTQSGNPHLQAESSQSYDFGLVLQPDLRIMAIDNLTFTIDRWRLRQAGIVGVVGADTIAVEDYLNRTTGGHGNANVARAAPTADDIAFFSGSGLAPVGAPTVVSDGFKNLQPQILAGMDLSLACRTVTRALGTFEANIDATHLDRFSQPRSPEQQALYDAREAGIINPATPLDSAGNQLQVLGNPKWKATTTLTWTGGQLQVGASLIYTGSTLDTNFLSNDGAPWHVASATIVNLYAQYALSPQVRMKVGARNLFDRSPPLQSDGFNGALYNAYGRYLYFNVGASF